MLNQKGVLHLALPLIVLLILGVVIVVAVYLGFIKIPLKSLPSLPGAAKQESTVALEKQYQNPFDENTQYVNPFSEYQNPFDNLK